MLVQDVRRQGDALVIQKHGSSLHLPAPLQCYPDQVVQAVQHTTLLASLCACSRVQQGHRHAAVAVASTHILRSYASSRFKQ